MMEEEDIKNQIKQFPSSFDLDTQHLNNRNIEDIIKRLQRDEECGYDCMEETIRTWNLLSYLYWIRKDNDKAIEYNNKVLERTDADENIISLSNKVQFCLNEGYYSQTREYSAKLKILEKNCDYKYLIDTAKSELASSYSRFGPKYYDKCIKLYEEVVERNPKVYLWKYGLGLVYNRIMHSSAGFYSKTQVNIQHIFNCFEYVAKNADRDVLKGRGWLRLGELIYNKNRDSERRAIKLYECESELDEKDYFEKALEYGNNDPIILQCCGRYFRYFRNLSKSKELLEKSIALRPSSCNHHHLALTIKSIEGHRLADMGVDGFFRPRGRRRGLTRSFSAGSRSRYCHNNPHISSSRSSDNHWASQPPSLADSGIESMSTELASMSFHVRDNYQLGSSDTQRRLFYGSCNRRAPRENYQNQEMLVYGSCNNRGAPRENYQSQGMSFYDNRNNRRATRGDYQSQEMPFYGSCNNRRATRGDCQSQEMPFYGSCNSRGRGKRGDYQSREMSFYDNRSRRAGRRVYHSKSETHPIPHSNKTVDNRQANDVVHNQKMLKSPLKIPRSPENPQFLLAVNHLKKSIELSDSNNSARLDLGILYVHLEEDIRALSTFKEVLDTRSRDYSAVEAARSYEQQGLCLREMSAQPKYKEEKEALLYDAKMCFYHAIESIAMLTAKRPDLGSSWHSFPTLKNMLITSKEITKNEKLKEIAKLCELLRDYGEAVDFYKQILDLTDEQDQNPDVYSKLVQNYLKIPDFDNAILFLNLWYCTENDSSSKIFLQLYVKSHLYGALHKLKSGDDITASLWYYHAYLFTHKIPVNIDSDNDRYHVAIFSELAPEFDEVPNDIEDCLKKFKLIVTRNGDAIPATQTDYRGYISILKESGHIVLVLQRPEISGDFQFIIDQAIRIHSENKHSHPILVITVGPCIVPEVLACVPHLQYKTQREETVTAQTVHPQEAATIDSYRTQGVPIASSGTLADVPFEKCGSAPLRTQLAILSGTQNVGMPQIDSPSGTNSISRFGPESAPAHGAANLVDLNWLADLLTELVIHTI